MKPVTDTQVVIDACHDCALACERWLAVAMAARGGPPRAGAVSAALDCAQYCRLIAAFLSRGSRHAALVCEDGAEIGQDTLGYFDCDPDERAQDCAQACRHLVQACLRLTQAPISEAAMVAAGLPPSTLGSPTV